MKMSIFGVLCAAAIMAGCHGSKSSDDDSNALGSEDNPINVVVSGEIDQNVSGTVDVNVEGSIAVIVSGNVLVDVFGNVVHQHEVTGQYFVLAGEEVRYLEDGENCYTDDNVYIHTEGAFVPVEGGNVAIQTVNTAQTPVDFDVPDGTTAVHYDDPTYNFVELPHDVDPNDGVSGYYSNISQIVVDGCVIVHASNSKYTGTYEVCDYQNYNHAWHVWNDGIKEVSCSPGKSANFQLIIDTADYEQAAPPLHGVCGAVADTNGVVNAPDLWVGTINDNVVQSEPVHISAISARHNCVGHDGEDKIWVSFENVYVGESPTVLTYNVTYNGESINHEDNIPERMEQVKGFRFSGAASGAAEMNYLGVGVYKFALRGADDAIWAEGGDYTIGDGETHATLDIHSDEFEPGNCNSSS